MEKKQLIEKIIDKAIENEWKPVGFEKGSCSCHINPPCANCVDELDNIFDYVEDYFSVTEEIIFDHDFAKAFFGEELVCSGCLKPLKEKGCVGSHILGKHHLYITSAWMGHLQRIVLEEDRIKYLEKFL